MFVVRLVDRLFAGGIAYILRMLMFQGSFIDAFSNPYIGAHEKGFRFSNRETESFPFI